jgi:hypothetical protein
MPHKDPTTWSALEWSIALLVATFSGMARVMRDVTERKSVGLWLNGFRYCDNWLENLRVSSSMCGYRQSTNQ